MDKVRLGDICDILNGFAFKSSEYQTSGIRVIRITNVQNGYIEDNEPKYYSIDKKSKIQKYLLNANDLLISLTGNVGRVGLLPKEMLPAALNQRVACIRKKTDKNISINYIFNILNTKSFEKNCILNSNGIAQKNLSTEWLKDYLINIPSLEEQHKICNILNNVQNIIDLKKEQIELLNKLIKSKYIEMFENKNFAIKPIRDLVNTHIIKTKKKFKNGEKIKYIDISSIDNKKNIVVNTSEFEVGKEPSRAQQCLEKNDILISTVRPNLKNIAINEYIDDNIVGTSGFCVLRAEKCLVEYLLYTILTDKFTNDMVSSSTGANYPAISNNDVLNYKIKVPALELQEKFAQFVKKINSQKFIIEKSLKETEEMKESLVNMYFG